MTLFHHTHPIIAIDGTAASGKGTLARRLAAHYKMAYLDTGGLYRAVALAALRGAVPLDDPARLSLIAATLERSTLEDPALRTDDTGQAASIISVHPAVREALLDFQRRFALNPPLLPSGEAARGAILDGRDIGTVICPDARLKLFVTAQIDIRAERRWRELRAQGSALTLASVLADMRARDHRDATRAIAPMKPADDALVIDTSAMTIGEVLDFAARNVERTFHGL